MEPYKPVPPPTPEERAARRKEKQDFEWWMSYVIWPLCTVFVNVAPVLVLLWVCFIPVWFAVWLRRRIARKRAADQPE